MLQRLVFLAVLVSLGFVGFALHARGEGKPAGRPVSGLDKRVPWTTSKVRGMPDPPSPYKTEVAFPRLQFDEPLDIVGAPGGERLFVVERFGKVFSFDNDPNTDRADLLLDLNQVLGRTEPKTVVAYGFTVHPQVAENGFVYVTYVIDTLKELPEGTRVSRFKLLPGEPPRCDPQSEQILITWPCGGHNGGCLAFGPDGCLYIATGDSSGIADQYLTGQDMGSLAGKILRIDVDQPEPGKPYSIPADNPFAGAEGARPEIWAYGLRQPWKISFDRATGDLWTGNVGQDLWEQIYLIERGGNYGWSVMEGSHPFRPERSRGPTPILMPIVEHDHANFRSITGGFVYHGRRLEDLAGSYIYGDYDTGRIWMLRYDRDTQAVTEHRELVDSSLRLVGFAEDSAGELHLLDHVSGRISRLVPNPAANSAQDFPRRLSETGLFESTKSLLPAAGVIPYSVIAPQWCDGAEKERLLGLPGESRIEFEAITYPQPAPGAPAGWKFPDGTVIAETLFLEMEAGNPASRRRLETRILHHERLLGSEEVGDQYWQGYTYVWDDQQTDAVLLEDPQGLDRTFTIRDPKAAGGQRRQTWHFPSRTECTACHNMAAKYSLGVQTLQMNKDHDYGGLAANQLSTLDHVGFFAQPLPAPPEDLPRLADYRDASQDIDLRARAYLHANCSHCHRKWGGGNAEFQLLATLELGETGTVGVRPGQGNFNVPQARIVAGRDPYRSILLYRTAKLGPGRMPRIGSNVVDEAGVEMLHDWIAQLPGAGVVAAA
ncbi:MAG: PQQ-dependent sugar dehydrogenase, partial [Pirellulales bacterium]